MFDLDGTTVFWALAGLAVVGGFAYWLFKSDDAGTRGDYGDNFLDEWETPKAEEVLNTGNIVEEDIYKGVAEEVDTNRKVVKAAALKKGYAAGSGPKKGGKKLAKQVKRGAKTKKAKR